MLKAKGQGPETQHSTAKGQGKKIHLDDTGLNKWGFKASKDNFKHTNTRMFQKKPCKGETEKNK